jgi:tRNA dimethylallyltransferase
MVAGEITAEAARTQVIIDTRQYVKRQRTWFRHQLPDQDVTRLDPTAPEFASSLAAWADAT